MKLIGAILCLAAIVPLSAAQRGEHSQKLELPQELKDAMERAKSIRFSGRRTVTVVRAGKIETHTEYVTKDGGNLRIEFAKDSPYVGQIIVETQEGRRHYFPDRNEIRVYPSIGKRQFEAFRGLFRSSRGGTLHIDTAPGGQIAGLHVTRYQVADRNNNPVAQIFIEPHSGMVAKRVLFDPTGAIAGSYEFTSLTLNPRLAPGSFMIMRKGAKTVLPIDELRKQVSQLGMSAYTLKPASGYQLESVYTRDIKGSKVVVQNLGKEDSRLTLFMTKSSLNPADLRRAERGELSSYVWTFNGITFILIGDQPEERLRALASQVSE